MRNALLNVSILLWPLVAISFFSALFGPRELSHTKGEAYYFHAADDLAEAALRSGLQDRQSELRGVFLGCLYVGRGRPSCSCDSSAVATLLKRALDLPGVTVVVPFVESQLHRNIFSPVQLRRPDLAATVYGALERRALAIHDGWPVSLRKRADLDPRCAKECEGDGCERKPAVDFWNQQWNADDFKDQVVQGGSNDDAYANVCATEPMESLRRNIDWHLCAWMIHTQDRWGWDTTARLVSRKFVERRVLVGPYGRSDIVELVGSVGIVESLVRVAATQPWFGSQFAGARAGQAREEIRDLICGVIPACASQFRGRAHIGYDHGAPAGGAWRASVRFDSGFRVGG